MLENYKGIMLCSRPQESINLDYHKPFVSRVTPQEPMGYNPVKQLQLHKPIKQNKPVLTKHKEWLMSFQKSMKEKKSQQVQVAQLSESQVKPPMQSVKQLEQTPVEVDDIEDLDELVDEDELNELLGFAKDLDYQQYIDDLEIRTVMEALKKRVEELRQQRPKQDQQQRKDKVQFKQQQQQQTKPQEEQWDKSVVNNQRPSMVEQVAKKLAEEILKKNKYLRSIHSNISMQRLIEVEAKRQMGM